MLLSKHLIKLQFTIDHASVPHRFGFLGGMLAMIVLPWLFLFFLPQLHAIDSTDELVNMLKAQTVQAIQQREAILSQATQDDTKQLVEKYAEVKNKLDVLNRQILNYHDNYIDEKSLAKIFYATILGEANDISIESFSTIQGHDKVQVPVDNKNASQASSAISVTQNPSSPAPAPKPDTFIAPELTHYAFSLKGDYFTIMKTLKRLEDLKWQFFWDKFNYEVINYPRALVKIEFYTLKLPHQPVKQDVSPGAAT